ncbi:MAG: TetR/AcrR family transcriptional regulator [Solobacterium sp.]|nr:TetR/AcrR family transcriptional regulator [Solobacterium sp.]
MSLRTFEKLPADKQEKILSAGIREFSLKSFRDASTDVIIEQCQISKGILFHYFGSKKKFYLYCLNKSMERLTCRTDVVTGNDFYEILFAEMNRKIRLCMEYRDEMHMVNMSSRDASSEIAKEKAEIMAGYASVIRTESAQMLRNAMNTLHLKNREDITAEGLQIYINAVINRYLIQYQQDPDQFFENSESIRTQMKEYLDLMLYGICKEEKEDHE